jgi:hypothetical protein
MGQLRFIASDERCGTYSFENEFENVTINVSSPSIFLHEGQELLYVARWREIISLILLNSLVDIPQVANA